MDNKKRDFILSTGGSGMFNVAEAVRVGPANRGNRSDGKICTAQAGECRMIGPYYSGNMDNARSWKLPCALDMCDANCGFLSK